MTISPRQSRILSSIVKEYVRTAKPVSSDLLKDRIDIDISPATIRLEMGRLSGQDYIRQIHVSSGRIPTDKGYRYFVESYKDEGSGLERYLRKNLREMRGDMWDIISSLTPIIAQKASTLTVGGLPERRLFSREGLSEVLSEPEFEDKKLGVEFAEMLEAFEKKAGERECKEVEVFIGSENPFGHFDNFSVVLGGCLVGESKGVLGIIGPKRMSYRRNMRLIKEVVQFLEDKSYESGGE